MCQLAMRKKKKDKAKKQTHGFSILISKTLRAYECPVNVANLLQQPCGQMFYVLQSWKLEAPLVLATSVSNST